MTRWKSGGEPLAIDQIDRRFLEQLRRFLEQEYENGKANGDSEGMISKKMMCPNFHCRVQP